MKQQKYLGKQDTQSWEVQRMYQTILNKYDPCIEWIFTREIELHQNLQAVYRSKVYEDEIRYERILRYKRVPLFQYGIYAARDRINMLKMQLSKLEDEKKALAAKANFYFVAAQNGLQAQMDILERIRVAREIRLNRFTQDRSILEAEIERNAYDFLTEFAREGSRIDHENEQSKSGSSPATIAATPDIAERAEFAAYLFPAPASAYTLLFTESFPDYTGFSTPTSI